MRSLLLVVAITTVSMSSFAGRLIFANCSSNARSEVRNALEWLEDNMDLVDNQMGRNGLKDWPGNSRNKFVKKLDKNLKIKCIDERKKCQDAKADGSILRGRVVPILHQRRIALCSNNLDSTADYVSVLAHEIGHLVRLNAHRTNCVKKYEKPRFAQSVGLAAYHAYRGFDYDSGYYTPYCP